MRVIIKSILVMGLLITGMLGKATPRQIPVYSDPKPGMFFREWLLCGPFPNELPQGTNEYRFDSTSLGHYRDYLVAYGGEGKIHPYEGMKVTHPDGHELKWTLYRNPFGLIPLNEILSPSTRTVAYAACIVHCSVEKRMVLSVTSNDGVRIWQNGVRIIEHNTMGSEEPDRDWIPVTLKKGDNYFCVKISQGMGKWSFQFRFLDYAKAVSRVQNSAWLYTRPEIEDKGNEYQVFVGQRYKIELLNKKIPAQITILDADGKHVVASYETFLGETLRIPKSTLDLIPGLHPVSCCITLPNGNRHSLSNYIFVGKPPNIEETYKRFRQIPLPDSTFFWGRQVLNNWKCMDFQLAEDNKAGNLEAMDAFTQSDLTNRFEAWSKAMANAPTPYHKVFPAMQQIKLTGDGSFEPKADISINDFTHGEMASDLDRIQKILLPKKVVINKNDIEPDILIGLSKDFPGLESWSYPSDEAYRIVVDKKQVKIIGAGIRGLHFGLVTLKQLLEMQRALPAADIIDFPRAAHRATFQYLPVPMNDSLRERILDYVDLKYNEIIVRSSDYRNIDDPKTLAGIREYFNYIKGFHIEPVPLLWIDSDPSYEEGFFLEDEPIAIQNNRLNIKFQRLVDAKNSSPEFRSKPASGIVYVPGKDYWIRSTAPVEIVRIPSGRMPETGHVYFTGDIIDSRAHRFSKACPSEELAYQEFDRLAGLIIKNLNPVKVHVNHDELGLVNSDSRCLKRNLKEHELMAYQVNRMRDILKKHDPNVEMIMWADCVNPYHNAGLKSLEAVGELLNKDIIMAHWYYTAENFQQRDLLEMGASFMLNKGFRTYGSPWDHLVNHQAWERILLNHAGDPGFWGLMHTEWYGKERSFGLSQTAEVNWKGKTWLTN